MSEELIPYQSGVLPVSLNEAQVAILTGRTPENKIQYREGPKGTILPYVSISYALETLNRAFGHRWSINIVSKEIRDEDVIVHIRLILHLPDGNKIVKEQYGSDTKKQNISWGDTLKSATSDGIKKCLSEVGWAADVYSMGALSIGEAKQLILKLSSDERIKNILPKLTTVSQIVDLLNQVTGGSNELS